MTKAREARDPPAWNAATVAPRRDRQTIGLFQLCQVQINLMKYIGTESNHLEDVGVESTHTEQAIVPNRPLQRVALTETCALCPDH